MLTCYCAIAIGCCSNINKKLRELTSIEPCQGVDNKSLAQTGVNSSTKLDLVVGLIDPIPKRVQNLIKLRGDNLSPQTGGAQRRVRTTLLIDCYEL